MFLYKNRKLKDQFNKDLVFYPNVHFLKLNNTAMNRCPNVSLFSNKNDRNHLRNVTLLLASSIITFAKLVNLCLKSLTVLGRSYDFFIFMFKRELPFILR